MLANPLIFFHTTLFSSVREVLNPNTPLGGVIDGDIAANSERKKASVTHTANDGKYSAEML